jgi:hypothetical protein
MIQLRCPHRKFGEVTVPAANEGQIEVACPSRWCGKREGVTVLHVFSTRTGKLLKTRQYRSPKGGKQ